MDNFEAELPKKGIILTVIIVTFVSILTVINRLYLIHRSEEIEAKSDLINSIREHIDLAHTKMFYTASLAANTKDTHYENEFTKARDDFQKRLEELHKTLGSDAEGHAFHEAAYAASQRLDSANSEIFSLIRMNKTAKANEKISSNEYKKLLADLDNSTHELEAHITKIIRSERSRSLNLTRLGLASLIFVTIISLVTLFWMMKKLFSWSNLMSSINRQLKTLVAEKTEEVSIKSRILIESSKLAALGEMASGIAHEINNPLAVIQGRAEQLKNQINRGANDPAALKETLNKIEATALRIGKIVRGLRSFARKSETDPMTLVNVSQIIEDAVELCSARFKYKSIELKVSCCTQSSIECREAQISQIIINLLCNAHDAIEELDQKWISIEALEINNLIRINITDSGNGIPSDVIEKMMQPFFTTKEVGKGTGLGLSISKGIAKAHHGDLRYDKDCKNTRFILEIPMRQPHVVDAMPAKEA